MGQLISYTSPVGVHQLARVEPISGVEPTYTVSTVTQNGAFLIRFRLARAATFTKMGYYVGAAAGNVDLGLYTGNTAEDTFTRIASTGTTAAAGTNAVQEIALTASITLQAGIDYWAAFATDSATVTLARLNSGLTNLVGNGNKVITKATSFVLPTSIATPSATSITPYLVLVP